ncbi:MAG: flagellar hook-basal body complex protein [Terriglobia bacterium]|jgi:flagellar hook protein FlgE
MSSFSTSLSGLDAEEQALSVIANDLSNLNTTAFKTGTPIFSDLFYQMLGTDGAGDPVQVGVGATMRSVDSPFTQGSISTTGVPTDVAIQGNGLFVLERRGTQVYTRAGNFTLNAQGNLVDSNGNYVMGYPAVNGAVSTSQSLAPIVISSGQNYPPNASSNVQLDMNLDSSATLGTATGTLTVPPPLPAAGQTVTVGGTTYTFASTITPQSAADTVLIGPDVASTLANLAGAINASSTGGQAAGKTYGSGTIANTTVMATGSTATGLNLQAKNTGALGNSDVTSTNWTAGSFGGGNLSGGVTVKTATATFTVPPATLPTAGQTVTIGGTTYTFVSGANNLTAADDVLIGTDVPSTLVNLVGALTASQSNGQGPSQTYGPLTSENTSVNVTGSTANTITLTAPTSGAVGNSTPLSSTWGAFEVADLTGGANNQSASATLTLSAGALPPSAGQTVTIGGTTYTFVSGANNLAAANDVLIGADAATTLANLFGAITKSTTAPQGPSSTYGPDTSANSSVTASLNAVTNTITLTAANSGAGGNSTAVSTNWNGALFAGGDLAGGMDGQLAAGTLTVSPPLPTAGQTVTVGGTTYTFASTITNASAANTVLIGPDVTSTMANLAGAINAETTEGQGAGITYGNGTVANPSATATNPTGTTLTLQATQNGEVGNSVPTSTNWKTGTGISGSFGAVDLSGGADGQSFSTPITVYDSLGNSHVLNFSFTINSPGTWSYQITIPASDVGTKGAPQVVGSGTLQFDSSGNLISPSADVTGIDISGLADGAKTMSLDWQLFSSPGNSVITQTAEPSATSGTEQNGYSAGTLKSYSINSSGVIDGVLSNGQTVALGQIALATFPNYDGLTNLGSDDYQASLASGAPSMGTPGTGGSGTLDGGSLEASNVDIATAFTMLIQAERGYEANAKAITTADNVMQASINLIQG